jgi:tetratricopeptide (TPR) repeat protein
LLVQAIGLRAQGRDREALQSIQNRLAEPELELARALLEGELCERLDNVAGAREAYEKALKEYPEAGVLHLRLGAFSRRRGDLVEAERRFVSALSLAPLPEAAYEAGELSATLGRQRAARSSWALAVAFEAPDGHFGNLARERLIHEPEGRTPDDDPLVAAIRLAARGATREALTRLEQHEFSAQQEPAALSLRGRFSESADVAAAFAVYRAGLARHPDDATLAMTLGVLSFHRGDIAQARRLLLQAWAAAKLPEVSYYLGEIDAAELRGDEGTRYRVWTAVLESDGGEWRKRVELRLAQ